MDSKRLDKYRRQLSELLRRMREDVEAVTEQARGSSGGQGAGELTNVPMHLGDMGTAEFLHDLNATLLENEEFLVLECREALQRIEQGRFGQCESCGKGIPAARLDVLPYARHCVACAEDAAKNPPPANFNRGRPAGPRDTLAPEAEMGEWQSTVGQSELAAQISSSPAVRHDDRHAVGEAGGGTAFGGLAGANSGRGDPTIADLQDAMATGAYDLEDARDDDPDTPRSGRSGGAVGGTPAGKRVRPR